MEKSTMRNRSHSKELNYLRVELKKLKVNEGNSKLKEKEKNREPSSINFNFYCSKNSNRV